MGLRPDRATCFRTGIISPDGRYSVLRRNQIAERILLAVLLTASLPLMEVTALAAGDGMAESASKTMNMSVAYGITTVLTLLLAVGYCVLVRKKNVWLLMLHIAVVIVNLGYFSLSISKNLSEALLANRISYLGSVFLPFCMLMPILDVCRLKLRKWLVGVLFCISVAVFLISASPGYLECYYQDVSLVFVNGMAKLEKVYGPLHAVYLVYLLTFFGLMTGAVLVSILRKKTVSHKHAILLLTIVLLNLSIWLVEQFAASDFEFLAVSYIVSELLLLMLHGMMQDYGILLEPAGPRPTPVPVMPRQESAAHSPEAALLEGAASEAAPEQRNGVTVLSCEQIERLMSAWPAVSMLTFREADVLRALLANKKRKDIAADLNITEHTVKKHTANIFSKFHVSNRAELFAKAERETPAP